MKGKQFLALLFGLFLVLTSAATCLAGEYLAGTVSNENWKAYYGRGASKDEASRNAIRNCGGTDFCRAEVELVESGQCIALVDSAESVSVAWGKNPATAIKDALQRCADGKHTDCRFVSMECAR